MTLYVNVRRFNDFFVLTLRVFHRHVHFGAFTSQYHFINRGGAAYSLLRGGISGVIVVVPEEEGVGFGVGEVVGAVVGTEGRAVCGDRDRQECQQRQATRHVASVCAWRGARALSAMQTTPRARTTFPATVIMATMSMSLSTRDH